MFKFGKASEAQLITCDPRIQEIMRLAILRSKVDFGINEGHRSLALQQKYFTQGLSEKDGIIKLSNHQYVPSKAVDVYAWVNGKRNYGLVYMAYLAGVFNAIAMEFGYDLHWGANWDDDGELMTDQRFQDSCHHEIKD
jgi:peptidoglycan L-alanyl-D-glutamate endopeptidase CwlK